MRAKLQSNTFSTGLAIFSMFFGAGNVVFPLAMGQYAKDQNIFAVLGLLITAVGVPFLGLMSMTLYDGNYREFFGRIGKIPGFIISLFIIGLIGPFGAMPRVIVLAHSTTSVFIESIPLWLFSALSCVLIFVLTYKRSRILDILGYILTPLLLLSLLILIIKGIISSPDPVVTDVPYLSTFLFGLKEGYKTMDLMGAFFFSSIVILCLKKELVAEYQRDNKRLMRITLNAGCIGMSLLALIYIGASYMASKNSQILALVPDDEILATLAMQLLGPYAGIIAIGSVALACLTTAMALSAAFSEYIHEDIAMYKISYEMCLAISLVATFMMSTLEFDGIMKFLVPILNLCYPTLIFLCVVNIMYKLYDFKPIKIPVLIVFVTSLLMYWY